MLVFNPKQFASKQRLTLSIIVLGFLRGIIIMRIVALIHLEVRILTALTLFEGTQCLANLAKMVGGVGDDGYRLPNLTLTFPGRLFCYP